MSIRSRIQILAYNKENENAPNVSGKFPNLSNLHNRAGTEAIKSLLNSALEILAISVVMSRSYIVSSYHLFSWINTENINLVFNISVPSFSRD